MKVEKAKVIEVKVNMWIEERTTKEQESRKANWRLEKRGVQEKAKTTMTRQATPFPATTTQSPGCLYTPLNYHTKPVAKGKKGRGKRTNATSSGRQIQQALSTPLLFRERSAQEKLGKVGG
ncbi:uncharacterized protein LOC105440244 isoform X2 [Strongylocentrotus purpuratus]|uniref:Uncharacterized protein n=1 Tax=Strongylocentrotus purpuratus TaxID=7668 RepID=A0A7M7T399_STRPU|nr:uncharacterized protein LOC105440244 isoform X2 [Strongylocentrotus purpuratus]